MRPHKSNARITLGVNQERIAGTPRRIKMRLMGGAARVECDRPPAAALDAVTCRYRPIVQTKNATGVAIQNEICAALTALAARTVPPLGLAPEMRPIVVCAAPEIAPDKAKTAVVTEEFV